MIKTLQIVLKESYDFYFGYRVLKAGDILSIALYYHNNEVEDIRVVKSSRECYPGFGIKIYQYELDKFMGEIGYVVKETHDKLV